MNLKSFSPAILPDWQFLGLPNPGDNLNTAQSYAAVPFVFNAVGHIAGALSTLPYVITRGDEDVTEEYTPPGWSDFLYLYSAWQLLFGQSYFKPSANKYGASQWVGMFPGNMQHQYNSVTGELDYFDFYGTPRQRFTPDDPSFLWQWWPNVSTAQGPGVWPALVALGDANLLARLNQFATTYFMRGGPITLLTVEGNPQQGELDKVEKWWQKVASTARAWFKGIAIRASLKPVQFGSSIKDAVAVEMQQAARENVVIAFNLPPTAVMSNYASFATAEVDALMVYEKAVMPLARRIGDKLNQRWFMPQGVKLDWREETLPVYQNRFFQLAATLQSLTTPNAQGVSILDVNEARVALGKKARPVRVQRATTTPAGTTTQPGANGAPATDSVQPGQVNSVLTNLTGMQQVNLSRIIRKYSQGKMSEQEATLLLTSGFGVTLDEAQKLLGIGDAEMPLQSAVASVDLERWQRKAINALQGGKGAAVAFTSDSIPATEHARISAALGACKTVEDVRAVFASTGTNVQTSVDSRAIMELTNEIRLAREALEKE